MIVRYSQPAICHLQSPMRLAYFSPLNPAPSGISDYSEELLSALPSELDITLVVDGYVPTNPALARFRVLQDAEYDARAFDLALYQLGNSPAHAYIYKRALRAPGVIVLHDLVLHHLIAWLTLEHGDTAGYIAAMRDAYGEAGAQLAARETRGEEALNRFQYPLSERVIRTARGVIVHSRYVADAVQEIAPNVPIAQIAHELPLMPLVPSNAARARLNLPQDALLIGTFGNLGPTKRAPVLFEAFRAVREKFLTAQLILVGASSPNFDAQGLIDLFHLHDATQIIGHVPFDLFQLYMAAMDVCVNLRYPTAGETSGAALRMMAQAKPVLVSEIGWFAELPGEGVIKIPVDAREAEMLHAALERLCRDAELRARVGANARSYVLETCQVQDSARAYADFLNDVIAERATNRSYVRAWEPPVKPDLTEMAASGPIGAAAAPTPSADWKEQVARACAELEIRDDENLRHVARAITELGL